MENMKRILKKTFTLLAVSLLAAANSACAMNGKETMSKSANAEPLQQSYSWHDGERVQKAWLDPNLIAHFGTENNVKDQLTRGYGEAREVVRSGVVQVYALPSGTDVTKAATQMQSGGSGAFSPVFHETPNTASPMRALPGGVIVQLPKDWSSNQVDNWLKARNLQRTHDLSFSPNLIVVDSAPGLASLELANRLNGQSDVVSAQPNWWVQRETR